MHAARPETGAATAALALHALAEILEHCRTARLTRNQHVLFRLGELIAWVECAASLARRAAAATDKRLDEKADSHYGPATLSTMARILTREAAAKLASDGLALVIGADASAPAGLADAINLRAIHSAQAGMIEDMNDVADALYGRQGRPGS